MTQVKRILITPGEPAGIGPDISIQIAQKEWPVELVAIADADLLLERAKQIQLPLELMECDLQTPSLHQPGTLKIIPIPLNNPAKPGELDPANAQYVIATLSTAAKLCMTHKADAVVTGPVHKGVINDAGIAFSGHTEFFASYADVPLTVMLFVVDQFKVALVTTHLPLAKVPAAITKEHLQTTLLILNEELKDKFHLHHPRILVCGLNPHAGENGHMGREEIEIITPLINSLSINHYNVKGPLPADTIFTPKYLREADVILAMYHDQALPLVKYVGFNHGVNVTLGLPFIRTSVDHGTALDMAAKQFADAGSMNAALQLAISLCK